MPGHSRLKDGVASARLRPGHPRLSCAADHKGVGARDKAGHDKTTMHVEMKKAPAKPGPFDICAAPKYQRE
jgi:hypothetical protein